MDFDTVEKAINDTKADIEKYLKRDGFAMGAAFEAWSFINANQKKDGYVTYKCMDEGIQVEMQCNKALVKIIMMNMLEEYGIEEFIELEAVRRITSSSFQRVGKKFETPEEMEVFKKMHNMSAEDIEKLKNEK